MRKPSRQRVEEAVRRDYMRGQNTFIEGVELDDGMLIVEYKHRSKISGRTGHQYEYHCEIRIVVAMPDGRVRNATTVTSWFEDKKGNRKRSHP